MGAKNSKELRAEGRRKGRNRLISFHDQTREREKKANSSSHFHATLSLSFFSLFRTSSQGRRQGLRERRRRVIACSFERRVGVRLSRDFAVARTPALFTRASASNSKCWGHLDSDRTADGVGDTFDPTNVVSLLRRLLR